jgi:hypothetical protein
MSSHAKDHHKIAHIQCLCTKNHHVNPAAPADLDHELVKVWNALNEAKCRLMRHANDGVKDVSKIYPEQELLNETEAKYKKENIWGGDLHKNIVPKGQATLNNLVDDLHEMIEKIQSQSSEKESAAIKEARDSQPHGTIHV